jgi:hypothetical protein
VAARERVIRGAVANIQPWLSVMPIGRVFVGVEAAPKVMNDRHPASSPGGIRHPDQEGSRRHWLTSRELVLKCISSPTVSGIWRRYLCNSMPIAKRCSNFCDLGLARSAWS